MSTSQKTADELKESVKTKYNQISQQSADYNASTCCGSGEASQEVYNIMSDDYSTVQGYNRKADLGPGCGLPTQFARIKKGNTVIDLGSGAGNDCFIARHEAGPTGIYSITVFARKPDTNQGAHEEVEMIKGNPSGPACAPGSGCC